MIPVIANVRISDSVGKAEAPGFPSHKPAGRVLDHAPRLEALYIKIRGPLSVMIAVAQIVGNIFFIELIPSVAANQQIERRAEGDAVLVEAVIERHDA
jgi:hypothetical protein